VARASPTPTLFRTSWSMSIPVLRSRRRCWSALRSRRACRSLPARRPC